LNSTANFSLAGTYTLRLTVSDGLLSTSDDVVVLVNAAPPVNLAPVVSAGSDLTLTLPSGITLAGSATDDGLPTGNTLTKSWTKISGPGTVSFGNAAALNSTANFSLAGTYTLRLTVSDGLLSASDDVVVLVNAAPPVNLAPVVNSGPDATITLPSGIALTGIATDDGLPNGGSLSVTWSKVSGPGAVAFVNMNSLNASATFSVAGSYTLRLSVSDGLLSSSDDMIVIVAAPQSCGNAVSGTLTLSATATDNVGVLGVQLKVDGANLGAELTTTPYSILWNTTSVSNGCHTLSAVARDAAGNQGATSLQVNVSNP